MIESTAPSLVPAGAELVGETSVQQALGISFDEPDELSYLTAPIHIYKTQIEGVDRFDVAIQHNPIDGEQLLGMLGHVAPSNRAGFKYGVIADWDVIDRQNNGEYSRRLVEMHQHLGFAWNEFVASQPAFLQTLRASLSKLFEKPYFLQEDRLLTQDEIYGRSLSMFSRLVPTSIPNLVDSLAKAGVTVDEEAIIENVRDVVNNTRLKKKPRRAPITNPLTVNEKFRGWSASQRRGYLINVVSRLSAEEKDTIAANYVERQFDSIELPTGEVLSYPKALLKEPLADVYDRRVTKADGVYEGEFVSLLDGNLKSKQVLVQGSVRRVKPTDVISPHIAWTRDTSGNRELVIERAEEKGKSTHYVDGVLGALAIAYFSPEITDGWPEHLAIRDSRKQFMGAAQVPVLALMRRGQLLKSDFVEAIENQAA